MINMIIVREKLHAQPAEICLQKTTFITDDISQISSRPTPVLNG